MTISSALCYFEIDNLNVTDLEIQRGYGLAEIAIIDA